MVEPITMLGAIGVWTVGAAAGGAIGNMTDRHYCKLQQRLAEGALPRNHDLEMAVRRAQMLALRLSLKGYNQLAHARPREFPGYSRDDIDHPLTALIRDALTHDKIRPPADAQQHDVLQRIEAVFTHPAPTDGAPAERQRAFRRLAEDWTLAEVNACVTNHKDWRRFVEIVREGKPSEPGRRAIHAWWDTFRAFMGEAIKRDSRLAAILTQQGLSEILDRQIDMTHVLEELQRGQEELLAYLAPALAALGEGIEGLDEALAKFDAVLDALYAIQQTNTRIESEMSGLRDDVRQLLAYATRGDPHALRDAETEIERLRADGQVRDLAIAQLLEAFGEQAAPPDQLVAQLAALPARLKELIAKAGEATNMPAEFEVERRKARDALEVGDLDRAERIIAELLAQRRRWRFEQEQMIDQSRRDDGRMLRLYAEIALTRLEHTRAAELFAEAANAYPQSDRHDRWVAYMRQARALLERGEILLDPAALRNAALVYRDAALPLASREAAPADWATTQNNLGTALQTLGERGDDTALRDAIAAYRLALEVRTREAAPTDWATTQNNLGNALATLGERGDDTSLRNATAAFRLALEVYTREAAPADWAMTQNNLGTALQTLGARGDDAALRDAIASYRLALQVRTREAAPADWVTTQNNLGDALRVLGDRGDEDALREAIAILNLALEILTREAAPAQWEVTQNNLGNALTALGRRGDDAALRDAIAAYRLALEVCTRDAAPAQWAMTQNNLGEAMEVRGDQTVSRDDWQKAADCYRAALTVFTREIYAYQHDEVSRALAKVLAKLDEP